MTPCGGRVKTLRSDKWTNAAPERDNIIITSSGEYRAPRGECEITLKRDDCEYYSSIGDKLRMRGPCNKGPCVCLSVDAIKRTERHSKRISEQDRKILKAHKQNCPLLNTKIKIQLWPLQDSQLISHALKSAPKIILCTL